MLAELIGWFAGRDENRRRFPRVRKDYAAQYSIDGRTWQPAYGVDASGGGLGVVIEKQLAAVTFDVRLDLDGKAITVRVFPVWNVETTRNGKRAYSYGLQFVRIGTDDWDALMRWITGKKTITSEDDLVATIRMRDGEIAKLIPAPFRERLLAELSQRGRLPPGSVKAPQDVTFDYCGVTHVAGRPFHKLTIHSKVLANGRETRYSTQFRFDDSGEELVVL
ncbi:MAG: PilZ domain-containing protein [Candidatus Eremiobacteraeota bacterium]|nr:PilZ domain-containing protein [Candidatus Eremiobacteraeota bacterium]